MIIADTNLLLRAVLDDDVKQSHLARRYLAELDKIALPLPAICEFVWVLSRRYKLDASDIASSLRELVDDARICCNRDAVDAGLAFLDAGGDFADGVIEFEGRRLGGDTFVSFDKRAVALIQAKGRKGILLDAD
ncbi:PilT protein domain protein [Rhizobium sp. CF080]|jgi:predicted nucleic-acid-binding protein|uniref:type II toxin-antitoxin system VapC family toxin n=1 Tax=Rhizobium sp. (strain CF080) TaxID=1144310 RepID=UPI000271670F|nr:type II toxin-antitoxin system VapC family toxin [Rhizobium sp. CF080]EUB96974.1 PilT protein domain protein [Rhizobium sp. CF080]